MHPSDLVPYGSLFAVVVAIVFGTLTVRQWQRARYLSAAAELVHTIQNEQFGNAIARIVELPVEATPDWIRRDPVLAAAAYTVGHVFESLGVLVFHRVLRLHLVDYLVGGYVRISWARLKPYVESRRVDLGPTFGEWFQWLADQLDAHPAPGKGEGAHRAFVNWRP